MPIYIYECINCGKREEVFCKHSEADATMPCDNCGARMIRTVTAHAKTAKQWEV